MYFFEIFDVKQFVLAVRPGNLYKKQSYRKFEGIEPNSKHVTCVSVPIVHPKIFFDTANQMPQSPTPQTMYTIECLTGMHLAINKVIVSLTLIHLWQAADGSNV